MTVTDPAKTRRLTAPFAPLFHPIVAVAGRAGASWPSAGGCCSTRAWPRPPTRRSTEPGCSCWSSWSRCSRPASTSSGTRRRRAAAASTPGAMGAGLYLFWPAFYTDVTDSYRLGRGGPAAHRPRRPLLQRHRRAWPSRRLVGSPATTPCCWSSSPRSCRCCASSRRSSGSTATTCSPTSPACPTSTTASARPCSPGARGVARPAATGLKPWARAVVTRVGAARRAAAGLLAAA